MASAVDSSGFNGGELSKRNGHPPTLLWDRDEHVLLAGVVRCHAHDLDQFTFPEGRDDLCRLAFRLERGDGFCFQVA